MKAVERPAIFRRPRRPDASWRLHDPRCTCQEPRNWALANRGCEADATEARPDGRLGSTAPFGEASSEDRLPELAG
jgi:hypothetical protein